MDRTSILEVLRRHAHHSSAPLALNSQTRHFTIPDIDGVIAYRPAGRRHVVQIGSVYADPADQEKLLRAFHDWAAQARRRITAVQLVAADLPLYGSLGYALGQLGASYSLSTGAFTLRGRKFEKIRNKIARARRAGITVAEAGVELPYDERLAGQLDDMDRRWLKGKGWHVKRIEFMVGERDRPGTRLRRLFVAVQDGEPLAYVSYSPVWGAEAGWLYDVTRREPAAPPGVVDLIFVEAMQRFQAEGAAWVHMGLTPFRELLPEHRPPVSAHPGTERIVRFVAERGDWIYPAASQAEFKEKWRPDAIRPEYVGFHPSVSLSAVWGLLRLIRAI